MRLSNIQLHGSTADGTVAVQNISFHKSVLLRYTQNRWTTHTDVTCVFQRQVDSLMDEFVFSVNFGPLYSGLEVEFCLCYRLDSCEFWDNNQGVNYRLVAERRAEMVDVGPPNDQLVMFTRRPSLEFTPYW